MKCPRCGIIGKITDFHKYFGPECQFVYCGYTKAGLNKFRCKSCERTFKHGGMCNDEPTQSICVALYYLGLPIAEISKALNIDRSLIYKWKTEEPMLGRTDDLLDVFNVIVKYKKYLLSLPATKETEKSNKIFDEFFKKNQKDFECFKNKK